MKENSFKKKMQSSGIFLAGKFVETTEKTNIYNPATQAIICSISLAQKAHIEEAIVAAQNCRKIYQKMSLGEVSEALLFIGHQLTKKKEDLAKILCLESAKPMRYALGEVERAIQTFLIAAEECKRPPNEILSLDWTAKGVGKKGAVNYFSKGIIAGIAPFNFPINLVAHKVAPAIASKSPILLKPSSSTPLSALFLADIVSQTTLPKGAVSVLPCTREIGQKLVEDERIQVLSFTGSPAVGWEMKKNAGKKKVILELGGNAAAIVHQDADLDCAIEKLLVGGFAYSGQICIHSQRIFVQESIYTVFKERYLEKVNKLVAGDPSDLRTEIGPMIDLKNAQRIQSWINEAEKQGARVLCGNKYNGTFVSPTVVENATKGMKIWDEEVFGPVVCLSPYPTIQDAIDGVNDSVFGLQAALFTDSNELIKKCYQEIEVGGLIVNDSTTFRVDQMPYGGIKDSGFGREGVKYALLDFLEAKILVN